MHRYPFIFSNERKYRLQRHISFWVCWWVFQSILYGFLPVLASLPEWKKYTISSIDAIFYMAPHMFMAYSFMYFVIPGYIVKGRYMAGLAWVIAIVLATGLISSLISIYILQGVRNWLFPQWFDLFTRYNANNASIWFSLLAGLRGGITIGGMAAAIKLMKYWYMKEQRNLQLQKQNTESQLQLLKAQIHPHFLFNTLNNIYSHTQQTAPVASKLVMGLSDMLRYMLYECRQDTVPLSKELKLLQDYIVLEKIRYGNRLDVNLQLPDDTDGLLIAPLLLLPFTENCFKHGTSHMIDQPWISLSITIDDTLMHMKLVNGKAEQEATGTASGGIGISNVRTRLELIYPGKHELHINDEEEVFIVDLKLELERANSFKTQPSTQTAVSYA
jgi:sensor histidine kinase YesM